MKSFKDIFSEVAQPNNPEEQKFKDQHEPEVMDHPAAEDSQFTGEIKGKKRIKRMSDYVAGEDEKAYDQAYKESVDLEEETEELVENPQEEIPMMQRQLEFIVYAAEEIIEYLDQVEDPEEWYQNKLAYTFAQMKSLHAYAEGSKRMGSDYRDSDDYDYYAASYGYGK
jgi:hypothetical protein